MTSPVRNQTARPERHHLTKKKSKLCLFSSSRIRGVKVLKVPSLRESKERLKSETNRKMLLISCSVWLLSSQLFHITQDYHRMFSPGLADSD